MHSDIWFTILDTITILKNKKLQGISILSNHTTIFNEFPTKNQDHIIIKCISYDVFIQFSLVLKLG